MMSKSPKKTKAKKSGFIIPMAMVAAVFLFVIGVGMLCIGFNRHMAAIRANRQLAARDAADYGLTKAVYEMNKKLRFASWSDANLPAQANTLVPGADASYGYVVNGDMWNGYSARATGDCGSAHRTINCNFRIRGPFENAILTRSSMVLYNNSLVDWFNYDDDDDSLKVGTTSSLDGSVVLKSGVTINGDFVVGEGAKPIDVIDDQGATIEGIVYSGAADNDIMIPEVPDPLASADSSGSIQIPRTLTTSGKYDNIRLLNGGVLTIENDVELYVTGDVTLDNSAGIDIDPNAHLTIYLGGDLNGGNSSGFNNQTQQPPRLKLYGLETCNDIILKNSAVFYGIIYAPTATVNMYNGAELYGAVVADSYIQKNTAAFYYDASLRDVGLGDDFIRFVPTHWREQ